MTLVEGEGPDGVESDGDACVARLAFADDVALLVVLSDKIPAWLMTSHRGLCSSASPLLGLLIGEDLFCLDVADCSGDSAGEAVAALFTRFEDFDCLVILSGGAVS